MHNPSAQGAKYMITVADKATLRGWVEPSFPAVPAEVPTALRPV